MCLATGSDAGAGQSVKANMTPCFVQTHKVSVVVIVSTHAALSVQVLVMSQSCSAQMLLSSCTDTQGKCMALDAKNIAALDEALCIF